MAGDLCFPTVGADAVDAWVREEPRFQDRAVRAYVVSMWLALAQYTVDNPLKCVCAYYRGYELYVQFGFGG